MSGPGPPRLTCSLAPWRQVSPGAPALSTEPWSSTRPSAGDLGAYGFRLAGVEDSAALLFPLPPDAPALAIRRHLTAEPGPAEGRLRSDDVVLPLQTGGWLELTRSPLEVGFHLRALPDDEMLVHPYLAPVAALASRWLDRESFHAGAVVAGGGAWARARCCAAPARAATSRSARKGVRNKGGYS